jgi:hypothetical protein
MRKYGRFILRSAGFRAAEGNRSILDDSDGLVFAAVRYERKAKCIVYTQ